MTAQASRQWVVTTFSTDVPLRPSLLACAVQRPHCWSGSHGETPSCGPRPRGAVPLSTECGPAVRSGLRQNPGLPLACPRASPDTALRPVLGHSSGSSLLSFLLLPLRYDHCHAACSSRLYS